MTKLLIYSDLHLEVSDFQPDRAAVEAADVVVLAGDVHQGALGIAWARETFAAKPIVYVAGNHEFFGASQEWDRTLDDLRNSARVHDVHFLENSAARILNTRFLGCTLWTDFSYFGQKFVAELRQQADSAFPDYRSISADANIHTGLLTTALTISRHQVSLAWLRRELAISDPSGTVVVSHHFPHPKSCPPRFAAAPMTAAYGSNLNTDLIVQAGLWIHGHVHHSVDYSVESGGRSVRVISNPMGYGPTPRYPQFENLNFKAGFLMEQLPDGSWRQTARQALYGTSPCFHTQIWIP